MKHIKFIFTIVIGAYLVLFSFYIFSAPKVISFYNAEPTFHFWRFQSIDTMKYSRDLSREKLEDTDFDSTIDEQVKNIASTGATHVAIATPYDDEFLPMLNRWVKAARKYKLKVWFRGNWSGWEEWFDYKEITKETHIKNTESFIIKNSALFEDGDIFSSCPECENGALGDPRQTGEVEEYRKFIIKEYETTKAAFKKINKQVESNYFSMNGDVARFVMDKDTTKALDGIVTIDHYVKTPEKLAEDIKEIANESGGKIVLGEFGAPIPDIHGDMNEEDKAKWIGNTLNQLTMSESVIGVNYWLNVGGSTQIWDEDGKELPAVQSIREFYDPEIVYGTIQDELDNPIANARVSVSGQTSYSSADGHFEIAYVKNFDSKLKITSSGFVDKEINIDQNDYQDNIILTKKDKDMKYLLEEAAYKINKLLK